MSLCSVRKRATAPSSHQMPLHNPGRASLPASHGANPARTEPRPPGIMQGRLTKDPEQNGQKHSENGAPKAEPTDLRLLYPAARPLKDQEKRERLRLPAGGTVWLTGGWLAIDRRPLCGAKKTRPPLPGDPAGPRNNTTAGRHILRVDHPGTSRAARADVRQGRVPRPSRRGSCPPASRRPWLCCARDRFAPRWNFRTQRTRAGIQPGRRSARGPGQDGPPRMARGRLQGARPRPLDRITARGRRCDRR